MKIQLSNVRLAFAQIFEAVKFQGQGDAAFSATFILDPKANADTIKAINAGVEAVANEKWAGKAKAILNELKKKGNVCYKPEPKANEAGEVYDGFEDMHHISTRGKVRPTVIDRQKQPLTAADGKPYSGCYVNASIELWAQDNQFGKRINATLRGVQFVRDGDAFGGGTPASTDEFEDLGEGAEEEALA